MFWVLLRAPEPAEGRTLQVQESNGACFYCITTVCGRQHSKWMKRAITFVLDWSVLNCSVFSSTILEIVAVIRDGCCTEPSTLVYTHSCPLTHLHTLCSSVPTSRIFVLWDVRPLYAISKIFSCLGWPLMTMLRCRSHEDRARVAAAVCGMSPCWFIVWQKFITPITRRTHVGASYGSDYPQQVIVETKKITLAFRRWEFLK